MCHVALLHSCTYRSIHVFEIPRVEILWTREAFVRPIKRAHILTEVDASFTKSSGNSIPDLNEFDAYFEITRNHTHEKRRTAIGSGSQTGPSSKTATL